MMILPGWAKWLPFFDFVSEVIDAVPTTCLQCYVDVPVLGGIPVPGGCLVQLLGTCKPEPAMLRRIVHLERSVYV